MPGLASEEHRVPRQGTGTPVLRTSTSVTYGFGETARVSTHRAAVCQPLRAVPFRVVGVCIASLSALVDGRYFPSTMGVGREGLPCLSLSAVN